MPEPPPDSRVAGAFTEAPVIGGRDGRVAFPASASVSFAALTLSPLEGISTLVLPVGEAPGFDLPDAGIPVIGLEEGETAVLAVVPGTLPSLTLSAILVSSDGAEDFVASAEGLRGNS